MPVSRDRRAVQPAQHLAELAQYDQEPAYLDSEAYGEFMRETFARQRNIVERLGLTKGG